MLLKTCYSINITQISFLPFRNDIGTIVLLFKALTKALNSEANLVSLVGNLDYDYLCREGVTPLPKAHVSIKHFKYFITVETVHNSYTLKTY